MKRQNIERSDELSSESDDPNALPGKQELALHAVISHHTLKEAALASGVSETTLWRYMQDESFSRRLCEARRDAVYHAVIRLQRASSDAVTVLHDLMMKDTAPASARITAARTVIDYSIRAVEMDDLKARIDRLEEFIKAKQIENALDREAQEEGEGE